MAGDWSGWVLLCITYILIFFNEDAKKNSNVFITLIFILSLHHLVSIFNAYITPTIGASEDAQAFFKTAAVIAQNINDWHFTVGAPFYRFFLAIFYKVLGTSIFLSQELSIFAFLLSCFVFIKISKLLGYCDHIGSLLLLFGCLPSMVFLGSITLRESWLILFFMLSIFFYLSYLRSEKLYYFLACVFSAIIMSLFHEALVLFLFLYLSLIIIWQSINCFQHFSFGSLKRSLTNIVFIFISVGIYYSILQNMLTNATELEAFHSITGGKALSFVNHFRAYGISANAHARANYGVLLDASSHFDFLLTFFPTYFYYLFAPFPYQISNWLDVYAFFESIFRCTLIISAIITWKNSTTNKPQVFFLLVIYFMMSGLWSLGTMNYGTSIRHNLISYWILVLLLGPNINFVLSYVRLLTYKKVSN